ncbi:MAG: tungsten cofactor oxidoreductase radical SAM maturase [Bacillota bacterium]
MPRRPNLEKVYIELTTKCNFDCITCIRNSWEDNLGDMSDSTISSLLDQIETLPELNTVHFGGFGEPLSHPRIFELAEKFKEKNLRVEMITNGQLLKPELSKKFLEIGLDKIIFSMDAPEKDSLAAIRKNADLNLIVKNIRGLSEMRGSDDSLDIWLEFVAMTSNIDQLEEVIKLAAELGLDGILITNLLPYTEDMVDEVLYDTEPEEIKSRTGGYVSLHTSYPEMKLRTERTCNFIESNSASINWQGEVVPCYPLLHNYQVFIYGRKRENKSYNFGNINNKHLLSIWISDEYIRFRSRVTHGDFPSCPDCKYVEGCSMVEDNLLDCWGNGPTCADCLWYRQLIVCP